MQSVHTNRMAAKHTETSICPSTNLTYLTVNQDNSFITRQKCVLCKTQTGLINIAVATHRRSGFAIIACCFCKGSVLKPSESTSLLHR